MLYAGHIVKGAEVGGVGMYEGDEGDGRAAYTERACRWSMNGGGALPALISHTAFWRRALIYQIMLIPPRP